MKVNYVLLYGTPYLRYELFDTFKKMSDFIVKKSIVNYTIFEKMEDKKEIEMIYRDSDISVLENRIDKAIKYIEENKPIVNASAVEDILRGEDNESRRLCKN